MPAGPSRLPPPYPEGPGFHLAWFVVEALNPSQSRAACKFNMVYAVLLVGGDIHLELNRALQVSKFNLFLFTREEAEPKGARGFIGSSPTCPGKPGFKAHLPEPTGTFFFHFTAVAQLYFRMQGK